MIDLAKRLLAARRLPIYVGVLAALLVLPTIQSGLMLDDYVHRALFMPSVRAEGGPRGDWDLFYFQGANDAYFDLQRARGIFPWWTSEGLRLAFMRPLTSLSHALDYRLFPEAPALMHAENIALYGLLAFLAALFYRRIIAAPIVAGLAGFFYAVDDAHGFVVSWIANRNALLAAVFGFAALVAHDRYRRDGWRPGAYAAPLSFALAMLSGEAAMGTLPYLFAYALFIDPGSRKSRALSLAPYALIFIAYASAYTVLGYGARGGGMYIDPGREPLAFLRAVGERLPLLLLAQLAFPPSEIAMLMSDTRIQAFLPVAIVAASGLGLIVWLGARKEKTAAFWATGTLLSLVPVCATVPNDRLLLFPGLGAFGLLAVFLAAARANLSLAMLADQKVRGKALWVAFSLASFLFVFMHGLVAPLLLPVRALVTARGGHTIIERSNASLPPSEALAGRTLIIVNSPDTLCVSYALADRTFHGKESPLSIRHLAVVIEGEELLRRRDPQTLELTAPAGFLRDAVSKVYRHPDDAFHVGDVFKVPGMTVELLSLTEDGKRPKTVSFRFEKPLEDPSYVWVVWEGAGFVPFVPPGVGEDKVLQPVDVQAAYMAE
jgi:hypothetical protein